MFKGIIIGVGITTLIFIAAWLLRKKSQPSVLTYVVAIVALIVLSIEGIHANFAIRAKRNTNDTFAIVQTAMLTYLPSQAKDYTITLEQASALKLGLKLLLPDVSKSVSISDIANKTVAEASDAICLSIDKGMSKKVTKAIGLLVISAVILMLLMYGTYGKSKGRSGNLSGLSSEVGYEGCSHYNDEF